MLPKNRAEQKFEQILFLSRWLMAPMYMGLVVTLGMLMVVFLRDLWKYAQQIMTLSAEQVITHCRTTLTGYKVPKSVVFRDELPKTPIGKILRKDLKAEVKAEFAARTPPA